MKHPLRFPAILLSYLLILLLPACNLINPSEPAPCYLEVNSFTFDPTPTLNELGPSTSTRIRDVWVYVDNDFVGAYELPARFPVLKTGVQNVILTPGIYLNGIAATRSPYPFYRSHTVDIDLPESGTVTINPSTSYSTSVKASYFESFEGVGFSLSSTSISDTFMYQLPPGDPEIFEGASSGAVYLDAADSRFEVTSTTDYELPGSGAPVYLELNYKINQSMQVGLFVMEPGQDEVQIPNYTLNPTTEWNKIYIQLGYTVSAYASPTRFKIYFGAIKSPDVSKAIFYLDNIKVVHF